jgi:hypothetical protein
MAAANRMTNTRKVVYPESWFRGSQAHSVQKVLKAEMTVGALVLSVRKRRDTPAATAHDGSPT